MKFSLNRYLLGLSLAMDCVETELLGVTTNHGKRVAYMSMRMAQAMGLSDAEVFDIAAFAVLHDNGLSEEAMTSAWEESARLRQVEDLPAHCTIGERNIASFPFQTDTRGIVKYHHESWDGSGFFGLQGDGIPLMAQIIGVADYIDFKFCCETPDPANRERIVLFLKEKAGKMFSTGLVDVFRKISASDAFWFDLRNPFINASLDRYMPDLSMEASWEEVLEISRVFSHIIDSKSRFTRRHSNGLEEKAACMGEHYGLPADEITQLRIAASLHDVGKLAIPNAILDKPGLLTDEERRKVNEHTYYTRLCLESIPGFEEITEWAANHHEKLTGKGYPMGFGPGRLDTHSRLLTVLDIYQALTEDRPYRQSMSHAEAMKIIDGLANEGKLDAGIVQDVRNVFA